MESPPAAPRCDRSESLTIAETAARLHVSTAHVYRLARAGRLPAARVGTCWRIRAADLDALFPTPARIRAAVVAKAQDTWGSLATDFGVTPELLKHWNPGLILAPGVAVFVAP